MSRTADELRTEEYHDNVDDLINQDEGLPLMVEKKLKGELKCLKEKVQKVKKKD